MAKEAGYTAKGYWASNTVYVKSASPAFVRKMMKVADVRKINGNKAYSIIDNVDGETQEDKFTIVNNTHETTKRRSAPPRSPCGAPPADPLARSIAQYHTRGGRGVAQRLIRGAGRGCGASEGGGDGAGEGLLLSLSRIKAIYQSYLWTPELSVAS